MGITKFRKIPWQKRRALFEVVITMTYKQAPRVAARVKSGPPFADRQTGRIAAGKLPYPIDPQTLPEALRTAAELAEQKMQLEQQLVAAAPKSILPTGYQWPMES